MFTAPRGRGPVIPRGPDLARVASILREYREGCSYADIADRHGVSVQTVNRYLAETGATRRRSPAVLATRNGAIARALRHGDRQADIAARYDVSRETVSRVAVDADLPVRRRPRLDPATATMAIRRYQAGTPHAEITAQLGISTAALYRLLRRAGVTTQRRVPERYTDAALLEHLRTLARTLRRVPTYADVARAGQPAPQTYTDRYGQLDQALELAGLVAPQSPSTR